MTGPRDYTLDRARVRRSFGRAATRYDEFAVLQTQVREKLLARLDDVKLEEPALVVDVGCGTGHAAQALARRYPGARVLATDLAEGMVLEARRRQWLRRRVMHACADLHRLPLPDASADLLFCNLALQWCDLDVAIPELARVLKPHGLLSFTTFGPDTLKELRAAWAAVDDRVHVHAFLDMHDVGDALVRAGLEDVVLDVERYTLTYDNARGVMRDLKSLGAGNASAGRARGLTSPRRLAAVEAAYERERRDGRLPATYEVIYAHAWGAVRRSAVVSEPGEARVPLEHIGRRSS